MSDEPNQPLPVSSSPRIGDTRPAPQIGDTRPAAPSGAPIPSTPGQGGGRRRRGGRGRSGQGNRDSRGERDGALSNPQGGARRLMDAPVEASAP
ncbi:MAG: hypothetical protein WBL51_08855, partial [Acidimicrobiales bacterium]